MKHSKKYNMSFTAASLMMNEMQITAELYLQYKDWSKVRELVFSKRLLKTRTEATAVRYLREARLRIDELSPEQTTLIASGSTQDQRRIIWWSICKRYEFIKDFAMHVILPKFSSMDYAITHVDYIQFFDERAEADTSLKKLTESTLKKQEQVLFRMMREAEIVDSDSRIIPISLSKTAINALMPDRPESFRVFTIPESVRRGLV